MVEWQWCSYEQLSKQQLNAVLKLRQTVFVVEQNCPYQDADDLDEQSWHLLGWGDAVGHSESDGESRVLQAYLRVVPPGGKYPEPSIGRVLVVSHLRANGIGHALMERGLICLTQKYGAKLCRISAQLHLASFYQSLGFEPVSNPYDEDGIPHIEMLHP